LQTEPAVSRKLILIGDEVPGQPSMRASPSYEILPAGRLHGDVGERAGVPRENPHRRFRRARGDEPPLDRKRRDGGQHVAAIRRGVHARLLDQDLRKQEFQVDAGRSERATIANLLVQRIRAAEAVDLPQVGEPSRPAARGRGAPHRGQNPIQGRTVRATCRRA